MQPFIPPTPGYKRDEESPMMTPTPAYAGVDPNGLVVGKWKTGLFMCTSACIPNGCMAFLCPGVSLAQITARLGLVQYFAVVGAFVVLWILAIIAAATEDDVAITLAVIASVLFALFVARIRSRLRFLFSIHGSVLEDLFTAFACGWCAIAQMATHAESYEAGSCALLPRATLQGYTFG